MSNALPISVGHFYYKERPMAKKLDCENCVPSFRTSNNCLTADEIALMLGLKKKTFYRVWRDLPHFFVTPKGWSNRRLSSARFDYHEVIEHCKNMSRGIEHGCERAFSGIQGSCREVSGYVPIRGEQKKVQGRQDEERRTRVGRTENGGIQSRKGSSGAAKRQFDVLAGLKRVS